ncbi:hypothetical protein WDW89_12490 [Deltaproteobacteria bacterium TL4]
METRFNADFCLYLTFLFAPGLTAPAAVKWSRREKNLDLPTPVNSGYNKNRDNKSLTYATVEYTYPVAVYPAKGDQME